MLSQQSFCPSLWRAASRVITMVYHFQLWLAFVVAFRVRGWDMVSLGISSDILELTLYTRLASQHERSSCLCLPSIGIKGVVTMSSSSFNSILFFSLDVIFLLFCVFEMESLWGPGWPRTHRDMPAFAFIDQWLCQLRIKIGKKSNFDWLVLVY